MSVGALGWAWGVRGISPTQNLVLLALADHADERGTCWPGVKRMAEMACLTDRAVRSALRALAELGLVAVARRGGTSSSYRLLLGDAEARGPGSGRASPPIGLRGGPERGSPLNGVQGGAERRSGEGVNDVQGRAEPRSAKPSLNHQENHRGGGERVRAPTTAREAEAHGWVSDAVIMRTLEELGVGDLRFPDLPDVVRRLLEEGIEPDRIYDAARQVRRGGVERMRSARYLAAIARSAGGGEKAAAA